MVRSCLPVLLLLLLPIALPLWGQESEVLPSPFSEERHRQLIEEMDFNPPPTEPEEEEVAETTSPEEQEEKNWLREWLDSFFADEQEIGPITLPQPVYYLLLALLAGFVGYVIYRLLDASDWRLNKKKRGDTAVRLEEIAEDEIDFRETESLLDRAERNRQYKVAVRLQYLALLKRLHELELIRFQKDKVNRVYQLEMNASSYGDHFRKLTFDYERNWYGEYPLDRLSYRLVAERFRDFQQRLDQQFATYE